MHIVDIAWMRLKIDHDLKLMYAPVYDYVNVWNGKMNEPVSQPTMSIDVGIVCFDGHADDAF